MKTMLRLLLPFFLVILFLNNSYSQSGLPTYQFGSTCTYLNHTVYNLPCGQNCVNVHYQIPHFKQVSDYILDTICYNPFPYVTATGIEDPNIYNDDRYGSLFTLPFSFCFYDSSFTQVSVSSNGLITFDYGLASCPTTTAAWNISNPIPFNSGLVICNSNTNNYPKAAIMGIFQDLDPRPGPAFPNTNSSPADRKIEWRVEGSAPFRRLVVSYYHIGVYQLTSCGLDPTTAATFQIVIYEGTGLIDIFIQHKSCSAVSTNGSKAIVGIQDWTRTKAVAVPGKNADPNWTADNLGYRFVPSTGTSRFVQAELTTITGTHVAWGDTTTTITGRLDINFPNPVCPTGSSTQYIVKTTLSSCADGSLLTNQDTITINRTIDLFATATSTAATCGPPSGTITVTVPAAAGTAPFLYTLDNPPGTTSNNRTFTFTNVAAGPHTVYVSDANGCGSTIPITVALNGNLTVNATSTPTSCTGVSNGSITVTPPTGTAPFQYSLNGGAYQSSNVFNNLAAGNYTISVQDAGGCSGTTTVTVTNGPPITATASSTATTCPGVSNGTITVTPTSGTGPYQYSLDGTAYVSTNLLTNVSSGNHFVIVKDANGCTSNTIFVSVAEGPGLTGSATSTATSCAGVNNGTITVTATSGTPPYQYFLDALPPQASNVFTNVAAGTHTVVFKDANGCSSGNMSVTVAQGAGITGTATSTATSCPGINNGTITANATSGTGPYQYSLDGALYVASNTFTNVAAGNHTVVIKDANGCTSNNISVTVAQGSGITGTATSTQASCAGINNGTITATATSGTAPYQYSLDGAAYVATNVFTNVASGNHTIVIQDAIGCTSGNIPVTVAAGPGPSGTATATATSCNTATNGTITATGNGGTAPYQYSLDGAAYVSTNIFNNVAPGNHTIVIKDASGCISASIPVTVNAGPPITGTTSTTSTACAGVNNGTITVTASANAITPQYSLDGGPFQASNVFLNVSAGNHTVVIQDAAGCTSVPIPVTVAAGSALTANTTTTPTSCAGVNNGTITVTPTNGSPPYQYSLDGGSYQASNVFNNVAAGNHTIVFKDGAGCTSPSISVTVAAGAGVNGTASSTATSCNGASNGTITVTASNGMAPYQYSLDGGAYQAGNTFNNVAAGNHNVVIKDAAGCISSQIPVTVTAGAALTANITQANVSCNGLSNGSITVNVNPPGTAPFQYSLNNVTFQASNTFNGLAAGNYTVYFKDNLGCSGQQAVVITEPAVLNMNITTQPVVCNGQNNGVISITASGGTTPYLYSLNGITYQAPSSFNVAAGTYTVYVKDNNGCIKTQPNVSITQPAVLTLNATTQNATCNGGSDGVITANAGGGNGGYQYSIDGINFQASNTFNVVQGNYTVTVKDSKNCSSTTNVTVGLNNNLTFTKGNDTTICEGGSAQLNVTSNATQYSWTPTTALNNSSISNPVASPTAITQYTVTATLGNCSINAVITVNVNPAPVADAGADGDICFGQSYQLFGSGGVSYQWTPATYLSDPAIANPQVINPPQSVQYTLLVTDANNCTSLAPDIVKVNVTPPIKVTVTPKDTIVSEGDQIQLLATSAATSYSWTNANTLSNPNIPNPVATMPVGSIGTVYVYTVTGTTAAGCTGTTTAILKVYKGPDIYVPNAFTPNHDGKNDIFRPVPVGIKKLNYFKVYNRWGQLVFSTSKLDDGWDGTIAGIDQPTGTYVWVVEGVTAANKIIFRKGTVTLIR